MAHDHHFHDDPDATETQEWLDALDSVIRHEGFERAHYLLSRLAERATTHTGQPIPFSINTPYRNTIPVEEEARMPGDLFMERRIRSYIRWNAIAMVVRANQSSDELGGHISSFSSSATLYDVGFNYFFKGKTETQAGDLLYIQGHSSPGIYARAFLEGRITEEQLDNFRREVDGNGLSSYPHPWLMPDFWQFPTVSMGLGPLQAIYQAHFMRYLSHRGLADMGDRKVWAFMGDGEMDEPESLGAIGLAGRERLDNLVFVINCNLQRLDGPVRGNGKIIQELEGVFRGAGWNVIKVVWGRFWDPLLAKDQSGLLQKRMDEVVDGNYQNYKSKGGAYTREHFFGHHPELLKMVEHLSDDDILRLNRGGHDPYKMYAAYHAATTHRGQPTVILAKTVKGYGIGEAGEGQNTTHSVKKMKLESLKAFRDRFDLPISDKDIAQIPYYRPLDDSPELKYMRQQRKRLGDFLPKRTVNKDKLLTPDLEQLSAHTKGSGERTISTTMVLVRLLSTLVKDKNIGKRLVPIVPDEARTFGMEGMFRQLGIYSSVGQLYEPEDAGQVMYYKEDTKGQILEEGINESGAMAAWIAAATSYSNHDFAMIPFYVFYSMFGFQRIGDLTWAAGDIQARGFMIGATSGRTTLNGEGLQHQDGHSHLMAATIPNCQAYDVTYGYELVCIVLNGLKRMYTEHENCFYYITTINENYKHPELPLDKKGKPDQNVVDGIVKGMYLLKASEKKYKLKVQLLGSGAILREVEQAASILEEEFNIAADIWSVTSFNNLRKDGLACERWNMLNPEKTPKQCYVAQCFANTQGPVIAASDYMKAYADQIRPFVNKTFKVLGTDGFGRSDSREKLRHFFEVDRNFIVLAALKSLADEGAIKANQVARAIKALEIDPAKPNPVLV